jgi:hypothetical protein
VENVDAAAFLQKSKEALGNLEENLLRVDATDLKDAIDSFASVSTEAVHDRLGTVTIDARIVALEARAAKIIAEVVTLKAESTLSKAKVAHGLLTQLSRLNNNDSEDESETQTGSESRSRGPRNESRKFEICTPNWGTSISKFDNLLCTKGELNLLAPLTRTNIKKSFSVCHRSWLLSYAMQSLSCRHQERRARQSWPSTKRR